MNNQRKQEVIKRCEALGFKPGGFSSARGGACLASPDGVYYNLTDDVQSNDFQLVVIGQMKLTPIEYACLFDDYFVKELAIITGEDRYPRLSKQIAMDRGFYSIVLQDSAANDIRRRHWQALDATNHMVNLAYNPVELDRFIESASTLAKGIHRIEEAAAPSSSSPPSSPQDWAPTNTRQSRQGTLPKSGGVLARSRSQSGRTRAPSKSSSARAGRAESPKHPKNK